jgi:hypothetical protein
MGSDACMCVLCRCKSKGIRCLGELREAVCEVCQHVSTVAGAFLGEIVTRCVSCYVYVYGGYVVHVT